MNFAKKLLWGILSGFICLISREGRAVTCSFVMLASKYLTSRVSDPYKQMNFTLCSGAGICYCTNRHCNLDGDCGGEWKRAEDFVNVENMVAGQTICSGYITACNNAAGQKFYPTKENIVECESNFLCASCPSSGKVSQNSYKSTVDGEAYFGNPIYLCGQTHPETGNDLDGIYMMEVQLQCTGFTGSVYNHITDCFQMDGTSWADAAGSYRWTSSCYYSE